MRRIYSFTDYERSERIDDMRKSVSDYVMNTSPEEFIDDAAEFLRLKKTVIGSIDDGKLGRQDEIKFKHNAVLEVSLPKQEQFSIRDIRSFGVFPQRLLPVPDFRRNHPR